jgi:hypothetical protein
MAGMSARRRWVFSPLDRQAYLLVADDRPRNGLRAQRGRVSPSSTGGLSYASRITPVGAGTRLVAGGPYRTSYPLAVGGPAAVLTPSCSERFATR